LTAHRPWLVELMAEPCLVAAGVQASPRGAAVGTRDVALRAANAAFGDGVDVRRRNVLAALDADVGVAQVVCQDDDDIGLGQGGRSQNQRCEESIGEGSGHKRLREWNRSEWWSLGVSTSRVPVRLRLFLFLVTLLYRARRFQREILRIDARRDQQLLGAGQHV